MQIGEAYGLSYMETPVMEESSLFIRSIGRGTDVVEKEMYVFEDKDGTKVGLRPEFTASVARSYITHGLHTIPQPMKVWLWGPVFRHDRPQAGRYREFHQFDCEIMGERDPILDAETNWMPTGTATTGKTDPVAG
jgi:histidyl-tRNA synthetase